MFVYHVLSPTVVTISADSLNNAIKNYVRLNRNLKVSHMIIRDRQNHYKARMKYFRQRNIDKVGINIYPLPTNTPTIPTIVPTFYPSVNPTHIPTTRPSNRPSKSPTISPLLTIPEILNDTLPIPPLFSVTDLMTNKSYP